MAAPMTSSGENITWVYIYNGMTTQIEDSSETHRGLSSRYISGILCIFIKLISYSCVVYVMSYMFIGIGTCFARIR